MVARWVPETEEQLRTALADGRLDEGAHLDFKRELPAGKKPNAELARDLAMFANDGGVLVFGVAEPEAGRYEPTPIPLDGLRERIEQVAASRLDPPLNVDVRTIPAEDTAGHGFIIVRVPPSPAAPHMVDGRYYGRAGSTRMVLADPQVRSVIADRQAAAAPILDLLAAEVARDPIPVEQRSHAHLYMVARPRYAPEDLVLTDVQRSGGNWSTWLHKELFTGRFDPPLGAWAPDLKQHASSVGRRAHGAGLHTRDMEQDRSVAGLLGDPERFGRYEDTLLDLEVDEDGTLRLFCGRGSDTLPEQGQVLIPAVVAGLAMRVVEVASRISTLTGYVGTWDFAVGATGLRGVVLYTKSWNAPAPAYSADDYRSATSADTAELAVGCRAVGDRLTGRLLRGLGEDGGVDAVFPRAQ